MSGARGSSGSRDYRLDFFRGLALIFIFVDHIPDNVVSYATLRMVAFCDAAEVFIFISGYTAALVYSRAIEREGAAMGIARIYRRVWQLYVAHLCLFMIFNAEVAYAMKFLDNPLFADELQIGDFQTAEGETFIRVLLLQFQPGLLNILPLYIALLLILPFFLLAMRCSVGLTLTASVALYVVSWVMNWNLPGFPHGNHWYFNPFAWQLLFVIAACLGRAAGLGRHPLADWRWLPRLALVIVVIAGAIRLSWMAHELFPDIPLYIRLPTAWFDKTDLPPARLVSMLALAMVVAHYVPRTARFLTSRMGWIIVLCGQNSLAVFCLTIVMDVMASLALTLTGGTLLSQLLINALGIAIMFAAGIMLAWFKGAGQIPVRPMSVLAT